ncbi:MAG: hypothetical protein HY321_12635, partial [Armatimonadetes bacterium]|nr:hypothetical protein [Armatimonadota bacterium]
LRALVLPAEGAAAGEFQGGSLAFRGRHTVLVVPAGAEPADVRIRCVALGSFPDPTRYRAINERQRILSRGECAPGKETRVRLPSGTRAVLFFESGRNAATVRVRDGGAGLIASADAPVRPCGEAPRLHFLVPRGTSAFTLHCRTRGSAPALQVLAPDGSPGEIASSVSGADGTLSTTIRAGDAGGVWSVSASRAGAPGELAVWPGPELPPILAASPTALVVPVIHYTARGALYLGAAGSPALLEGAVNVTPQPDRLVSASMTHAGSTKALWNTRPAPFSTGRVRVILPQDISPGSYDLKIALREGARAIATHTQRVVIAGGFAHLGAERPVVSMLPAPPPSAAQATAPLRAHLALDPTAFAHVRLQVALSREGSTRPAATEEMGAPQSPSFDVPFPGGAADGLFRVAVTMMDAQGKALASAGERVYVSGGRPLREAPPSEPAAKTVLRASQQQRGYVLFSREYHDAFPYNYQPPREDIGRPLFVWATPGEYEPATFGVFTLKPLESARVTVSDLAREGGGGTISASQVEVRRARFWAQRADRESDRFRLIPELLEPEMAASLPSTRISQYWLTLRIPENTPAGDYRGTVTFRAGNAETSSLKLLLKVLPFTLSKAPGRFWGLYADSRRWSGYSDAEIALELRDMKAHGIDALLLSPLAHASLRCEDGRLGMDLRPLSRVIGLYRKAGMRGPLVLDLQDLSRTIAAARGGGSWQDPEVQRLYLVAVSELAMRAASEGWPNVVCHVGDDPGRPSSPDSAARIRAELAAVKRAGLTTLVTLGDADRKDAEPAADIRCYPPRAAVGDAAALAALRQRLRAASAPFWWYGSGCFDPGGGQEGQLATNRYLTGVAFWRSGAAGTWSWTFQRPRGDAYDDFDADDEGRKDACLTYPAPGNHPLVPTLQWEGVREGIDDARYLYTFEQMVARCKASKKERAVTYARQVEKEAAERVRQVPWGRSPGAYGSEGMQALRIRLAKYMGTMLNKLKG